MLRITTVGTGAESVTVMLVSVWPGFGALVVSRSPVTWNPPPLNPITDGEMEAPALGGVGNATVYGGVPPVTTKLYVPPTHVPSSAGGGGTTMLPGVTVSGPVGVVIGHVIVATPCNCGVLESATVMLVVCTPLVSPVTEKPWPAAGSVVGEIDAPGRGDAKNTLYGGVPPVTTKFDVWLTQPFGLFAPE